MANAAQQQNQKMYNQAMAESNSEGWNELHGIYLECRALTTKPAEVLPFLRNKALSDKIKDQKKLHEAAQVLSKDAAEFNKSLEEIHQRHIDRTGTTTTPDDLMNCLDIGEQYSTWLYRYQVVVLPTVDTILSLYQGVMSGDDDKVEVEGHYIPAV